MEISSGSLLVVVFAVAKCHIFPTNFSDLEVDTICSLLGTIVIKAQNKNINGEVRESIIPRLTIELNGFGITNIPIAC